MRPLTLQIFVDGQWQDAATFSILEPSQGLQGLSRLGYDLDYALSWLDSWDEHACSLNLPVQLMVEHEAAAGFRFLDDIVPMGAARRFWLSHLGLEGAGRAEQELLLLEKGTIAPVGNLRIKESVPEPVPSSTLATLRFTVEDVVERNTDFLEYAQQMGAISGGATGAGGEAPKLLLRCSSEGEIWIDTFQDQHHLPDTFYLVKFPRGRRSADDCDILRAEFHFYAELEALGVNTIDTAGMRLEEGERYPSLWLPRFDVQWCGDHWRRFGLESVYSVLEKPASSSLNHFYALEHLCERLAALDESFDQQAFVCEWVRRDLLNIVFGNSDNHGRNTAFLKSAQGIRLAPIYDFAPMKADPDGVIRSTRWGAPYEEGGEFRWDLIAQQLDALCPADKLMNELRDMAKKLRGLKGRLQERGVPERILEFPSIGFGYLEQKLQRWELL
ncbi:serine/threonine-protein kinase HipA [Litorivivens lipolytica]|uniref:Serine/threonine-protein kinase HipA n=1 Tax=Litorivivens lipolytica TaxID=1524264 RepID=A0A7W4W798_9GAMM|nr:HipA domain-containing protein [Litorivivens lipolytica]MBB3048821.1 serine/threonine-protein kinase HipA [Litorivivens lipolytica]